MDSDLGRRGRGSSGGHPPRHRRRATVGRANRSDFILDAALVSRVHCRLVTDASGELTVEDLDSTNGTFVNDQRVSGRAALSPGDRLRVGRVELSVRKAES